MGKGANIGIILGLGAAVGLGALLLTGKSSAAVEPQPVDPVKPDPGPSGPGLQPDPNWPADAPGEIAYWYKNADAAEQAGLDYQTDVMKGGGSGGALYARAHDAAWRLDQTTQRIVKTVGPTLTGDCLNYYTPALHTVDALNASVGPMTTSSDPALITKFMLAASDAKQAIGALVTSYAHGCKGVAPQPTDPTLNTLHLLATEQQLLKDELGRQLAGTSNYNPQALMVAAQTFQGYWQPIEPKFQSGGCKALANDIHGDLESQVNAFWSIVNGATTDITTDYTNRLPAKLSSLGALYQAGCPNATPIQSGTPSSSSSPVAGPKAMNPECAGLIQWVHDMTPYVQGLADECAANPADEATCAAYQSFSQQIAQKQAQYQAQCGGAPAPAATAPTMTIAKSPTV